MVASVRRISLALLLMGAALAQTKPVAGTILVATERVKDEDFAHTLVLVVHADENGSVGLILNRKSDVPLARIFPDLKRPDVQAYLFYRGGPVMTGVLALLRSTTVRDYAARVFADVYVLSNTSVLKKMLNEQRLPPARLRIYAGYTGWGAGQLQAELDRGDWRTIIASPSLVFDPDPDTLWSRVAKKAR